MWNPICQEKTSPFLSCPDRCAEQLLLKVARYVILSVYHFGQNPVSAYRNPYVNIQSLKLQRLSGQKSQVLA